MATLGKTSTAGGVAQGWGGYTLLGQPFVASENGTINSVKADVDGLGPGGVWRGVVYEGTSTRTLLVTGAEVTVAASTPEGISVSTVSSASIISGHTYRMGMEVSGGVSTYVVAGGASGDSLYQANTYPTAPANMTSATAYTVQPIIYIDYTPTAATTNSGFFQLIGGRA